MPQTHYVSSSCCRLQEAFLINATLCAAWYLPSGAEELTEGCYGAQEMRGLASANTNRLSARRDAHNRRNRNLQMPLKAAGMDADDKHGWDVRARMVNGPCGYVLLEGG